MSKNIAMTNAVINAGVPKSCKQYLVDWQRNGCPVVLKVDRDAGARGVVVTIIKALGLHKHLAVATSKFAQHTEGHLGNAVGWVAQRAPQGLHQLSPHRLDVVIEKVRL